MKMAQEVRGDVFIVRLTGRLMGGAEADRVKETILATHGRGTKQILVDLQEVSWVNSTGLGILISSHLATAAAGGRLKLMRPSARIRSILAVTRLNTVFEIYDDEETALESFAG